MLEVVKNLEETWPEGDFYAQTLRHRLSMRHWTDDADVQKDAQTWLARSGIEFEKLAVIQGVDPMSSARFENYLGTAHVLARLAKEAPGAYPIEHAQAYLMRQQDFAAAHEFVGPVVEIAIARTLLFRAAGKKDEALKLLEAALRAAAPTGFFRVFVDEGEPIRACLEEIKPRLADEALIDYANRLLEAFGPGPAKPVAREAPEAVLSERELEVLRFLAKGLTYEAIGKQLFLSLNTVQFHVKNIYGKLLVNKRVQAIETAREMHLI
jgi:LuxR family maltose regulon positive regulatory protein